MKNIILMLTSLLFLTGCEKEVSSLQEINGVRYEVNSEVGFTGRLVQKYDNGQKRREVNFKDGKKDGVSTEWHVNGQKEFEEHYKDGKRNGLSNSWYENGQKKYERNFKDNKLVK